MKKELFIKSIEALKKQYDHDEKCSEAFNIILPNDFVSTYDNHYVTNQLIEILQIEMNDNHKDSWIEYYCYEIEFGKKNDTYKVYDKNKKEIPLTTPEDLWNLLNENKIKSPN